jgi:hypothetical protein
MTMKKIVFVAISLLLAGCGGNEDPFSSLDLNKLSRKEFVTDFMDNKILTEPDEDSTAFRYVLKGKGAEFPLKVSIYDHYDFGQVRKLEIDLGADEKYEQSNYVCRGCAPRSKKEVDQIFEIYQNMYGKPDSLKVTPRYKYKNPWDALSGQKPSILDKTVPPAKRALWSTDKGEIIFETGYPVKKPGSKELVYDGSYDSDARITYRMKGYEQEIKRISDSVRTTLQPNDLFIIDVYNPDWYDENDGPYDSRCIIRFGSIMRHDREEPKRVRAIRYDIVIKDSFKKELYRVSDQTFEFRTPIANITPTGIEMVTMNRQYVMRFNSRHPDSKPLQMLRQYDELNAIHTHIDIKTILFEDGSQLNAKI